MFDSVPIIQLLRPVGNPPCQQLVSREKLVFLIWRTVDGGLYTVKNVNKEQTNKQNKECAVNFLPVHCLFFLCFFVCLCKLQMVKQRMTKFLINFRTLK